MVAFGGAGGLHAVEVARELHIPKVIIPNYPGQFSALGMLMADIQHDYIQTYYKALKYADFSVVRHICDELVEQGRRTLESERVPEDAMSYQRFLDIRYSGQEFSIPVPIAARYIEDGDADAIRKAFDELHGRRYGYQTPEQPVEMVNVRVSAFGKRTPFRFPALELSGKGDPLTGRRIVYLKSGQEGAECPIYRRDRLPAGYEITGPTVVQEYASTTVLFPGDKALVASTGELVVTLGGGE
jgi:N-methylhydantoinase A